MVSHCGKAQSSQPLTDAGTSTCPAGLSCCALRPFAAAALQAVLSQLPGHARALAAWQDRCTAQLSAAYQDLAAAAAGQASSGAASPGEAQDLALALRLLQGLSNRRGLWLAGAAQHCERVAGLCQAALQLELAREGLALTADAAEMQVGRLPA